MANPAYSTRYRLSDGRFAVDVTENKTLTTADSGIVQNVIASSVTVTLPATATVGTWTVRDGGVKGSGAATGAIASAALPKVDPDSADTIQGFNVSGTSADGKYIVNTGGSYGDEVTIANTGATNGGLVVQSRGDWAREA
jgi:hypothetical protein